MAEEQKTSKLQQIAQISQVFSSISVVVGIVVAIITVYSTLRNANVAVSGVRLSTLSTLKQFIEDDVKIRKQAEKFLASPYNNPQKLLQLIEEKGSGKNAYDSDELTDLRDVGHHYEVLATLVKLEYLDFDLVFETIPFPDDFWNATEQFRAELRTKNWARKGQGLPDFWGNLDYLRHRYEEARRKKKRFQTN
jgi:hypothetical protein